MFFALVYLLRRVVRLLAGPSDDLNSDVELIVLRHQLLALKRTAGRPRLRRRDRLFMAAMSKALHRARWSSFVVSPQTLLVWASERTSHDRTEASLRQALGGEGFEARFAEGAALSMREALEVSSRP